MQSPSFDDAKTAFASKSDEQLKNARFIFECMTKPWLVRLGLRLTPLALKFGLPVKGIIRRTIFSQFVGGETLEDTSTVVENLAKFNVKVILDYGVEGKEGEKEFDHAADEFIRVIDYAATQPNIPYMSIKLTGLSRFSLLEKVNHVAVYSDIVRGKVAFDKLDENEKAEWKRVVARLTKICSAAAKYNVGVLIDAEESWIQYAEDALATMMMMRFNTQKPVIFNTAQLYRHDRLQYIRDFCSFAKQNNFIPAMKLVRGAYMEKERARAEEMNYPSPINATKTDTDNEFNAAVAFCLSPENNMHIVIGSHNEYSNLLATQIMKKLGLPLNDPRIHLSQLYGMSDNITFNLAKAGCNASKYLPFGPIKDVIPYLMRRAQENSSVSSQTRRELQLIEKELKRRRNS
ncbi:MAG TPA: proline dehydrogenase family protein [Hanamia sp.]|nr:proline dehydrogenase family protein [Hanamia sp.]